MTRGLRPILTANFPAPTGQKMSGSVVELAKMLLPLQLKLWRGGSARPPSPVLPFAQRAHVDHLKNKNNTIRNQFYRPIRTLNLHYFITRLQILCAIFEKISDCEKGFFSTINWYLEHKFAFKNRIHLNVFSETKLSGISILELDIVLGRCTFYL